MINHLIMYHKSSVVPSFQTKMNMFTKQPVNQKEKNEIAYEVNLFCARDMKSFHTIEGQGFIDMIQAIINLPSIKGMMNE